jgi:hypothetical protein
MMRKSLFNVALWLGTVSLCPQPVQAQQQVWPIIKPEMRPWTRWWWMGSAVDQKNLGIALDTYAAAGIGGVEITPIYGVKGYEDRYIDFLSPEWMSMLDYTVKKAGTLGMGVDMNTGTGWPFGGPQINMNAAASKFVVQQYQLSKGKPLTEPIRLKDNQAKKNTEGVASDKANKILPFAELQALTAYGSNGKVLNLLDKVDAQGKLSWVPADSDYELFALFLGKTMQKVKRAAPSGEGYTLDHLDKAAVNVYLKRFDQAFRSRPRGLRSFFNDSYEVYGANWTPTLLTEFKRLKGYDLSLYLRELTSKDSLNAVAGRVKSDYRETMGMLLHDNFTRNWTSWAHRQNAMTRNQSHGSPGNLLDLYAAVDIPETEIFGSSAFAIPGLRRDSADVRNVDPDPMMSKFASSAAHTQSHNLVSSETFTWLSEHFKTSFSQAKPEAEALFLSGINHIFYHGTTYTPAEVPFPGWLFYASTNMVPANSLWPQLRGMNDYYTRCQSVLQTGKADNELLVYWPVYDQWGKAKGLDMPITVHDVAVWLHPTAFYKQSLQLQQQGYSFDFASDQIIGKSVTRSDGLISTTSAANPYRSLIVPACNLMPVETLQQLITLAGNGGTVIFQRLPEDVPGLGKLEEKRKVFKRILASLDLKIVQSGILAAVVGKGTIMVAEDLQSALHMKNIEGEQLVISGLQFIRRKLLNGYSYYLVNHTAKTVDEWLPLNYAGKSVMILDPQSGAYGLATTSAKGKTTLVRVQLKPGETLFLQSNAEAQVAKNWQYLTEKYEELLVGRKWKLHFTEGGPQLPGDKELTELQSWTELADPKAGVFSGSAVYTSSFELPVIKAKTYLLDLGRVYETAHVWINGKDVGYIWSIPFEKRVTQYLVPGHNTIRVEVANLMANRIIDMDKKGIQWRNYHEINFVNINYKPFDASNWKPMPSGLLGPVVLKGYN